MKIPVNRNNNSNDATGSSSEGEEGTTQQVYVVSGKKSPDDSGTMDVTDRMPTKVTKVLTPTSSTASGASTTSKITRKRRTRVQEKPNYPLNLWSIIKNCIGKDLSKIPMPVNFNEPLSMLQR